MGKKTDHEDKGCEKMTEFLGEQSKCQTCSLPECAEDNSSIWWDGLTVGNDVGIREGVRGIVGVVNRYWSGK